MEETREVLLKWRMTVAVLSNPLALAPTLQAFPGHNLPGLEWPPQSRGVAPDDWRCPASPQR
jgi:hypothetical protein